METAMKIARSYEYEGRTTDVAQLMSMPGLDYLRGILRLLRDAGVAFRS